jgi:cystathionine beta-lyase/cystathionine gamma-synthase
VITWWVATSSTAGPIACSPGNSAGSAWRRTWSTPATPRPLRVADIEALACLARSRDLILVVDNTFPTPLVLRPIQLGATLVVHSVTKMLAGHSDVTLGAVTGPRALVAAIPGA